MINRKREETRPLQKYKGDLCESQTDKNGSHTETVRIADPEDDVYRMPKLAPVPVPLPRRSTRNRKLPTKFEDYQLHQMVARPYDRKLQAIDSLLKSGVLNDMDNDTAHKIIASIIN